MSKPNEKHQKMDKEEDGKLIIVNEEEFTVVDDSNDADESNFNSRSKSPPNLSINPFTPSHNKFELPKDLLEKLKNSVPESIQFIEKLQRQIERQQRKIAYWKQRNKKKVVEIGVQTGDCEEKNNETNIVNDIKDAAEQAMRKSGFVYEETSGMYYDYNTGYYYNAEYGLYYDGSTGTYMKYNQDTKKFEFHSQVPTSTAPIEKKLKRKNNTRHKEKDGKRKRNDDDGKNDKSDVEEGECSPISVSDDEDEPEEINVVNKKEESENSANELNIQDLVSNYPPCMRIMVLSTNCPKIKEGSLRIITHYGGSIGREGSHTFLLPDLNASRHHLNITYDMEKKIYLAKDLGSKNGTLLNGKRMAPSLQESESLEVPHGSKIQIGSTVLLCHVHEGSQTCGHCEPGLFEPKVKKKPEYDGAGSSKSDQFKAELKKLRRKFGVNNYEDDPKLADGYKDRAQERRETIGSQNPYEKTQEASMDDAIPAENKGFKMLAKMGWKEGQSIGLRQGLIEPLRVDSTEGYKGLGSSSKSLSGTSETINFIPENKFKARMQDRYNRTLPRCKAFNDSDTD